MTMGRDADFAADRWGSSKSLRRAVLLGPIVFVAWLAGCAGAPPSPPTPDTNDLRAAGFKVRVAQTQAQREHLQSLAPGRLTELQRTGVRYFVYPDAAHDRIYVGGEAQYAAYVKIQPGGAIPSMANSQAADLASYGHQDVGMQANTHRDHTDPYSDWADLNDIGDR